jgi:hypothetical protein
MTYPKAVIAKAYELIVAQGYSDSRNTFDNHLTRTDRKALCALVAERWPELNTDPLRELAVRTALDAGYLVNGDVANLIHTALQQAATARDTGGWVVGNADGTNWRTWGPHGLGPCWTRDLDKATRYHRRDDAEIVHGGDEDAWRIVPYADALKARDNGHD